MRHEDITPDMQVKIGDDPAVVLHTRPAPGGTVFVLNYVDGSTSPVPAAELTDRHMMPSLPSLKMVTDGTARNEHDRVFWFGGREYRIHSMWNDGTGGYTVEHLAEDGTRTTVMRRQLDPETAMLATVDAITALRQIDGPAPVEYIVEAQDKNAGTLRMNHAEADAEGRLHAENPEDAIELVASQKTATSRHLITGKESRRSVYQYAAYPVYADGWIGHPTLTRR